MYVSAEQIKAFIEKTIAEIKGGESGDEEKHLARRLGIMLDQLDRHIEERDRAQRWAKETAARLQGEYSARDLIELSERTARLGLESARVDGYAEALRDFLRTERAIREAFIDWLDQRQS